MACTVAGTRAHVEQRHPDHAWTRRDDATLRATRHAEYVLDGLELLNEERFTWLYMAVAREHRRREGQASVDPRWDPWSELRRRDHIDLEWAYISWANGLIEDAGGGRRRVTLDARLDRDERRFVLAHELVHDERGGGIDPRGLTDAEHAYLTQVDEADVDLEVERRLGVGHNGR